jgi:hypothetical protein
MKSPEHYQVTHPVGSWWLLPVQVTAHLPIEPDDISHRPLRLATKSVFVDIPQRDLDTLLPFATEEYTVAARCGAVYVTHTRTGNEIASFSAVPDMEHAWTRAFILFDHLTQEK